MIASTEDRDLLFSSKYISIAVVAIAVITRTIQLVFFYNMRDDASYQVLATQNFVQGHGISLARVFASDLSETIYQPLVNWPPGYSFLLSPFYILFNHNYIAAGLTLDILSAILLIIFTRRILKCLEVPIYLVNIFTLLTAFYIYYFYFIASSDAIAITFFIIAFYYSLKCFKTKSVSLGKVISITIALLICSYLKYLFIPVVFISPLLLLMKGLADRQPEQKKAGIIILTALVVGVGILLFYQKSVSGTAAYISAPGRGFFPQHLLSFYPFIPASFIKPDTIALFFSNQQEIEQLVLHVFQGIHLFFLLVVFILTILIIFKRGFRNMSLLEDFFVTVFSISLAITFLLMYLSITVEKEQILPGWLWTYVEEPRYYGLATVLIHLSVFVLYILYKKTGVRTFQSLLVFSILLLLPEFFRGSIFLYNRIRLFNEEEYSWQYEYRFQKYADAVLKKALQKYPTNKVAVTGSEIYFSNRVSLYNKIPLLEHGMQVNDLSSVKTKQPILLLVIINEKQVQRFEPFLRNEDKDLVGTFNGHSFYTVYVNPQ